MAVTIICLSCQEHGRGRVVMLCKREHASAWVFGCPRCGTIRAVTKDKAGGSVGAGRRDDGSKDAYGKGF